MALSLFCSLKDIFHERAWIKSNIFNVQVRLFFLILIVICNFSERVNNYYSHMKYQRSRVLSALVTAICPSIRLSVTLEHDCVDTAKQGL